MIIRYFEVGLYQHDRSRGISGNMGMSDSYCETQSRDSMSCPIRSKKHE